MVLAVLEAHCGVKLSGHDVYLNVAGGLRIQEPAADLAAAAALVSSLVNAPLPTDAVYFGEISLSGAVRPVAQTSARLKEAAKLGFGRAVLPEIGPRRGRRRCRAVAQQRRRIDHAWSPKSPRAAARRGEPGGKREAQRGEKCHTGPIPSRERLKRRDVTRPRRYTTARARRAGWRDIRPCGMRHMTVS